MCIVYSSFYCWLIRGHDTVWTFNGADIIEGFEKLKMTTTMAANMSFILKMTDMYKVMYVVFYDSVRRVKCSEWYCVGIIESFEKFKMAAIMATKMRIILIIIIKLCIIRSKLFLFLIYYKFLFNSSVHSGIMTSIVGIFQFCITCIFTCTVRS